MTLKRRIILGLVVAIFCTIWVFTSFWFASKVLGGFGIMLFIAFVADWYTTPKNTTL